MAHCGDKDTQWQRHPQQPTGASAGTPRQTTNRVRRDRLPKIFLSPQPLANTPVDTAPAHWDRQDSAPPTSGQAPVLPTKKPTQVSRSASPTNRWHQKQKDLQPLHSQDGRSHTQKVRQNETAEEYAPDEGTRQNPRRVTKWSRDQWLPEKELQSNECKDGS